MKKVLNLLAFLTAYYTSSACSCGPTEYDFYKNLSKDYQIGFAVLLDFDYGFEYMGLQGQTAYFELIDTLGVFDSEIGNTIVVTGQDGLNCGEIMEGFQIGDTMVLALLKGFYYTFLQDSFYLDGCGTHYQSFRTGGPNGTSIEELKDKIRAIISSVYAESEEEDFSVYPNPTIQSFYIRNEDKKILRVEIFDKTGRLVEQIFNTDPRNFDHNIAHYSPGLYVVFIYTEGSRREYKLVKM